MAKRNKNRQALKTEAPAQSTQLVVQELRVVSADRSQKDLGDYRNALQSAESVWNPNRVLLYDLYDSIILDGHLTGIINKRIDAILNKKIYYDKSGKKDEAFDDLVESEDFRELLRKAFETLLCGNIGLEFILGNKFKFVEIPKKHIKPELGIIAYEQYGTEGISYKGVDNLWVMGKEKDLGLLLKCAPYVIWKRGNMAEWAQYIEIFGQPVRIIYYDAYDNKTKMEVKQVLDESGSSLALMIPKQAQFEMKDGKQSNGDGQLQERFKIALDNELSVIILGNTETTTSSKSSGYAQAKEQSKQQLDITKSDMKYILSMLNSVHFHRILKMYGFPVEGGKFKFEKEIDLEALKTRLDIDEKVASKVPISDDYWYETYGIPKPDNYDELKAKKEIKEEEQEQEPEEEQEQTEKKPKAKQKQKDLYSENSIWFKLRATIADFFDHAP